MKATRRPSGEKVGGHGALGAGHRCRIELIPAPHPELLSTASTGGAQSHVHDPGPIRREGEVRSELARGVMSLGEPDGVATHRLGWRGHEAGPGGRPDRRADERARRERRPTAPRGRVRAGRTVRRITVPEADVRQRVRERIRRREAIGR
jgi:hypothetical protein